VVPAQGERDATMPQHLGVVGGDDVNRLQQGIRVDGDIAQVCHLQGIKRGGAGGHVVGAQQAGFGADLARAEARTRAVAGAYVQRHADESGIQALGGDHTIALPILRAMAAKHGPVAMVHVDAHADVNEDMFGERIAHGTPFRRAVEEGLLACDKVTQIGLRGTGYAADDFDWPRRQGFTLVPAHEVWHHSLAPVMEQVRQRVGNTPCYLSFDIDGIDPAYAGGTGTPEIGGLTVPQALEIIRGCRGLNIVGTDLVEVSPPYDTTGNTALLGANLLYEMLCVLPGVPVR
jgi:agmatinase